MRINDNMVAARAIRLLSSGLGQSKGRLLVATSDWVDVDRPTRKGERGAGASGNIDVLQRVRVFHVAIKVHRQRQLALSSDGWRFV